MTPIKRDFGPEVDAVKAARSFAETAVGEWGISSDDVVLVVGELAANAQRHARTGFSVSLDYVGGALLVEVTDGSPDVPALATPDGIPPDARSGRGLLIVDYLASEWGVEPAPDGGKTVWAEIQSATGS